MQAYCIEIMLVIWLPAFYNRSTMKQLFISHSRKDIEFTRRVTERFETAGLDAWVDWLVKKIKPQA